MLQADAPEDAAMYIHRVGRTARYQRKGKSLLLVRPEEEAALLEHLAAAKVWGGGDTRGGRGTL